MRSNISMNSIWGITRAGDRDSGTDERKVDFPHFSSPNSRIETLFGSIFKPVRRN
jgi:hypothetical protein